VPCHAAVTKITVPLGHRGLPKAAQAPFFTKACQSGTKAVPGYPGHPVTKAGLALCACQPAILRRPEMKLGPSGAPTPVMLS
jgi:hypothetical protein